MGDGGPGCPDEGLGCVNRFNFGPVAGGLGVEAIHLLGSEDRRGAGEKASFGVGIRAILGAGVFEFLVEDNVGGFLALADLSACLGPLPVGAPDAGAEAAGMGGRPKGHDVDASIGLLGGDVGRAGDHTAALMPGELEVASAIFDGGDELVGDVLMNVEPIFRHGLAPVWEAA